MRAALARLERKAERDRLANYIPYATQAAFHTAGARYRERLFMAANQVGKTMSGGMEAAMHATGRYPDWWQGKRFDRPTIGWAGGVTGESTRDSVQRIMLGRMGRRGTGAIPAASILSTTAGRGVTGLVNTITVRRDSGGLSHIVLKSYDQGREKWQAETLDWVWFDEEPPEEIYTEGLTRTNATDGIVWLTFTPLLGPSEVVMRFVQPKADDPSRADRHVTQMGLEEALHYSPERRAQIEASYPEHEREARTKGVPMLGGGRIFPISEERLKVDAFEIPKHWPQLGALDFGWDHPTAAVRLACDRDTDRVFVTAEYRVREATPVIHAAALKMWGRSLPWAWPHDGLQHDKGSGTQLAQQYRDHGLQLLLDHAQFDDGSTHVEPGLMDMLERMQTGRLKVFGHLAEWFEEFRLYRRKAGKVVKERDDLMSATRYGMMCLRFARTPQEASPDWLFEPPVYVDT